MAVVYEWKIHTINVKKDVDGMKDVIVDVYWELKATEEGKAPSDSHYQLMAFKVPEPDSFIEYSQLQKSDVISWIESKLRTEKRYENVIDESGYTTISQENELDRLKRVLAESLNKKNTIVQKVIPWEE